MAKFSKRERKNWVFISHYPWVADEFNTDHTNLLYITFKAHDKSGCSVLLRPSGSRQCRLLKTNSTEATTSMRYHVAGIKAKLTTTVNYPARCKLETGPSQKSLEMKQER